MAVEVGRVTIRVLPNTRGFRQRVERDLAKMGKVKVPLQADTDELKKDVERELGDVDGKTKVKPEVDKNHLRSSLNKATKGEKGQVKVDANVDISRALRQMDRLKRTTWGRKGGFRIEIPKYDFTGLKQLTAKLPKLPNIQERLTAGRATQRAQAAEAYSKALAAMRKQIRETKTDAELLKHALNFQLEKQVGDRTSRWLAQLRSGARQAQSEISKLGSRGADKVFGKADFSDLWADAKKTEQLYQREINALKKLRDVERSRANGKQARQKVGGKYNAEIARLEAALGNLRSSTPSGRTKALADLQRQAAEARRALGLTDQGLARLEQRSNRLNSNFLKGLAQRERNLGRRASLKQSLGDLKFGVGKAFSFDRGDLDRLRGGLADARLKVQEFGNAAREHFARASERMKQLGREAVELSPKIRFVRGRKFQGPDGPELFDYSKHSRSKKSDSDREFNLFNRRQQGFRRSFLGLTRTGWIVAAVASLIGPAIGGISAALAGIPALAASAAAVFGSLALGFQGVKDAAQAAAPEFNNLKTAMSDVYRERLTPQFAQLSDMMVQTREGMKQVANGTADFTQGMVNAVTSTNGIAKLNNILGNTGNLFSQMKPFAEEFTGAVLDIASAGSNTFPKLAAGLNSFGSSFRKNVNELIANGTLQTAIEGAYDVIGSFSTNVGRIIKSGVENFTTVIPGFTKFFDQFADGVTRAMPALSTFGNLIADLAGGVVGNLGRVLESLGPGMETLAPVLSKIGNAGLDGLGTILSNVGTGLSDMVIGVAQWSQNSGFLDNIAPSLEGVKRAWDGLSGAFSSAWTENLPTLQAALPDLTSALSDLSSLSLDGLSGAMNTLKGALPGISEGLAGFSSNSISDLQGLVGTLKGLGDALPDGFAEKIGSGIGALVRPLKDLSALDLATFGNLAGPLNQIQDLALSFGEKVTGKHMDAENFGIGGLFKNLSKWLNGPEPDVDKVNKYVDAQRKLEDAAAEAANSQLQAQNQAQNGESPLKKLAEDTQQLSNINTDGLANSVNSLRQIGDVQSQLSQLGQNQANTGESPLKGLAQDMQAISQLPVENLAAQTQAIQQIAQVQQQLSALQTEGAAAGLQGSPLQGLAQDLQAMTAIPVENLTGLTAALPVITSAFQQLQEATALSQQSGGGDPSAGFAGFATQLQQISAIGPQLTETFTGIGTAFTTLNEQIASFAPSFEGITLGFQGLTEQLTVPFQTAVAAVTSSMAEMQAAIQSGLSGLDSSFTSAFSNLASGVQSAMSQVSSVVSSEVANISSALSNGFAEAAAAATSSFATLAAGVAAGVAQCQGIIAGFVGSLPGMFQIDLTGSGLAMTTSFANGIRAGIPAIAAAAAAAAAAAKAYFPHSPAKKGPLSGSGYTDTSGMALVKDFAGGMLKEVGTVESAAEKIAGVVAGKFQDIPGAAREAVAETAKAMEGFKRTQVEDKARASNARKIQRAIENHDKALKRYEEREAKRRGEHAEKNAKRKKPTEYKAGEAPKFQMPELDKPDYDSIKRSFQEYWIDGLKEMMNQNLNNTIINGGFLDQFKSMGVGAVQALRSQFGGHPLLDQIEAGLNDPNFSGRVKKALEEAKIGEIPVTFALENLSQLKSDLGMGNGAISRAINQAVKFEPTNSDFDQERRAREREEKEPSIHYHVLSVEEVLRLEEVRHRKIQMRDHDD